MLYGLLLAGILGAGFMLEAADPDGDLRFQELTLEAGGQSPEDAVRTCERYFNGKRIYLPMKLPPGDVTHVFGWCFDFGTVEPHLDIRYANPSKPEEAFRLEIYPAGRGPRYAFLPFQSLSIEGDTRGRYYKGPSRSLQLLTYETGDWQYVLTSASTSSNRIGREEMASVARSHVKYMISKEPAYAQWGELAVRSAKETYGMDVVDYLYMGRTRLARDLAQEKFKLWLRGGSREFGVYVTVKYNPATGRFVSIQYEESMQ